MSFTFIYESENKKLKSFEKRDDLVLKEVRFQKKFPKESFEFATRKDAMDGLNISSTKLAKGIKDGKILIGNIEYKFERK